ncbi:MAG TPA: DUF6220 domain-containing protein [Candidatus Limnocylindrales bacterium]|jgi:hypothetical protein
MNLLRVHALAALVFVAAIVVQVVLAGLAIANLGGSGDFSEHADFGYTWVGLAAVVLLATALSARRPRRDVGIAVALFVDYIVQTALPSARGSLPFLAALHPLNAMVLFAVASWYGLRVWRIAFRPAPAAAAGMPASPAIEGEVA